MIQGGDPTGTGRGGESVFGGKFQDEILSELKHTGAGILSSANSGPNTNGSQVLSATSSIVIKFLSLIMNKDLITETLLLFFLQFFLTLGPTPWLDGKHTIFGRVCEGMGVVQRLGSVPVGVNDRPLSDVKIFRARIREIKLLQ